MSTEKIKANYTISRQVVDTLQAMSNHTQKDVNHLVETALKFFIATHNDYLGQTFMDQDDGGPGDSKS